MPHASPRPGDTPIFLEALDKLLLAGADARRPVANNDQIKVTANLSYYPAKGTIYRDGDRRPMPIRGVDALIDHLRETGALTAFTAP
jgi:hypothetical protein